MTSSMLALGIAVLGVGFSHSQPPTAAVALSTGLVAAAAEPVTDDEPELGATPEGPSVVDPDLSTAPTPQASTGIVRFVYFVEADEEYDPEAVDRIERQAASLQQFWFDQFGGTFFLPHAGVDVVYGQHPAAWYDTRLNGDDPRWHRLLNTRQEVWGHLGIGADDDVRLVVYPSARIDGRVGANRYGGAWMDGDDLACIDTDLATIPYSQQFPANCLTTVAHELGHVYGLGHDGAESDCMQLGFYRYVSSDDRCEFSDLDRELVLADPRNSGWLDAHPGETR